MADNSSQDTAPIAQMHAALSLLKIQVQEFRKTVVQAEKEMKQQHKDHASQIKQNRKEQRATNVNRRKPSGFCTPVCLSDALCAFLDKPAGSTAVRTEVTKILCAYIKLNELYNKERKVIVPDAKLGVLFSSTDNLTYFNLQRHMNAHYTKIPASL